MSLQPLEHAEHLVGRHAAGLRRAGAGRECRIEAVDVQAHVQRWIAVRGQAGAQRVEQRCELLRAFQPAQIACGVDQPTLVMHVLACTALTGRADAELREAGACHQPFLHRLVDPGAVATRLAEVIGPGVAVGIEVQHRQWPAAMRTVGAQQRQRDRVIATDPDHVVARDERRHLGHHRLAHRAQTGIGQRQVAGIAQLPDWRDIEVWVDAVAQHVTGLADRTRPHSCTGAVRGRAVPGDAGHRVALPLGGRSLHEGVVGGVGKTGHGGVGGSWLGAGS